MDEKDKQSLTFDDILHQLTKPSVIQGQGQSMGSQIPPSSVSPTQPPSRPPAPGEFKLPSLGGEPKPAPVPGTVPGVPDSQPSNISLSIRTMAQDIERLRSGQMPAGLEVKKVIKSAQPKIPVPAPQEAPESIRREPIAPPTLRPTLPPRPIARPLPFLRPSQPSSSVPLPKPSQFPPSLPGMPPQKQAPARPPSSEEKPAPEYIPEHFHKEEVVGRIEDALPEYLGASIPKKVVKPVEEKLQYRVLARIIGSGMSAGITATVVIAVIAYLLLSYFVFNVPEPVESPTPIPTVQLTQTPELNELELIFRNVASVDFSLPINQVETATNLSSFIKETEINPKEFKRIKFVVPDNQALIPNFTNLLDRLAVKYPVALMDAVKESNMTFMYGQTEILGESSSLPDPGLANKKVVLIVEVKDLAKATEILRSWESTMAEDLKNVLNIDPTRAATPAFNNNQYKGVPIRYKNFPLPDRSIDYAIVHSASGHQYIVITNSRESMYSPIEKITGL